jgi:hypothetical protein
LNTGLTCLQSQYSTSIVFFYFSKKCHWNFDRDYSDSAYNFENYFNITNIIYFINNVKYLINKHKTSFHLFVFCLVLFINVFYFLIYKSLIFIIKFISVYFIFWWHYKWYFYIKFILSSLTVYRNVYWCMFYFLCFCMLILYTDII